MAERRVHQRSVDLLKMWIMRSFRLLARSHSLVLCHTFATRAIRLTETHKVQLD